MKPLALCVAGVIALVLLRLFLSPVLSMKAIGEARAAVYDAYEIRQGDDTEKVQIADAVEGALGDAHGVWRFTDLGLDVLILIVVGSGTWHLARRGRLTANG